MAMYYGDFARPSPVERRRRTSPPQEQAAAPGSAPTKPIRGGVSGDTAPAAGPAPVGPIAWNPPKADPPPPNDGGAPVAQGNPWPTPPPPSPQPAPEAFPGPNPPIPAAPGGLFPSLSPVSYNPPAGSSNPTRPNDATAKGGTGTAAAKAPGSEQQGMTMTAPPAANPAVINQDPGTSPPGWPTPPPSPGGTGAPGGVAPGPGSMGGPGGTSGTSSTWGLGGDYTSPTGGLVSYYNQKMGSNGMSPEERVALAASTVNPIQQEAQQARDQMLRIRAATGNDAGLYGAVAENARNAMGAVSNQQRQNLLANEQVRRGEQSEGAAGNLNLYGQDQAETMEYLRMLGNLLGRQDSVSSYGSSKGSDVGIQYTPGM